MLKMKYSLQISTNEILNDSELRKKMSENSLKMAEKYTIDETAQVFADVFNRLMRN